MVSRVTDEHMKADRKDWTALVPGGDGSLVVVERQSKLAEVRGCPA